MGALELQEAKLKIYLVYYYLCAKTLLNYMTNIKILEISNNELV